MQESIQTFGNDINQMLQLIIHGFRGYDEVQIIAVLYLLQNILFFLSADLEGFMQDGTDAGNRCHADSDDGNMHRGTSGDFRHRFPAEYRYC